MMYFLLRGVRTQSAVVYRLLHKHKMKTGKKSQYEECIRASFGLKGGTRGRLVGIFEA